MIAGDADWTEVADNLKKARKSWGWMSRFLSREVADPNISGHFFKAVVHVVLIFGAETWVLNPWMERALCRFNHRFARRLTWMQLRRRGGWDMELSSAGGSDGGIGIQGDWGLRHKEAEYSPVIYCDAVDYGPL